MLKVNEIKIIQKMFLIVFLISGLCFICPIQFVAQETRPFSKIDDYLEKKNATFDNDEEVVKLFNQERLRLGKSFETELWKYMGDNLLKHYWISSFVDDEYYLQGNPPLSELSIKIREKAVELDIDEEDLEELGMKYSLLRDYSVKLYIQGKRDLAIKNKKKADKLLAENEDLGGFIGVTYEYIHCIFDNMEKDTSGCKKDN